MQPLVALLTLDPYRLFFTAFEDSPTFRARILPTFGIIAVVLLSAFTFHRCFLSIFFFLLVNTGLIFFSFFLIVPEVFGLFQLYSSQRLVRC